MIGFHASDSTPNFLGYSIRRFQWGVYGAFINMDMKPNIAKENKIKKIGDRLDIPENIKISYGGRDIELNVSGDWYIYSVNPKPDSLLIRYTLIRGSPDLAQFGDGEIYNIKDIATLFGFQAFSEAEEEFYITFSRGYRKYRTIVKASSKIKNSFVPIFDLQGGLSLMNIYERSNNALSITQRIENPPYRKVNTSITRNFYLLHRLGDFITLPSLLLEPGKIYKVEFKEQFYFDGENYVQEATAICVSASIIAEPDQSFTAASQVAFIMSPRE